MNPRVLAAAVVSAALSGCSAHVTSAVPPSAPSLHKIVHDSKSTLSAVAVRPGPDGYLVAAWWNLLRHGHAFGAIAVSDDHFRSAGYAKADWRRWARYAPPASKRQPHIAAFRDLVATPVTSLAPGTRAYVAGGDGATLLPFRAAARSTSNGGWKAFSVPKTHGDQAYTEGQVVLPDGRLLVLLDAWSSDRGSRPGPENHGLWASHGDDWSSYSPYRPAFSPALRNGESIDFLGGTPGSSRVAAHGLVVATTSEQRLYVSIDGGRRFHAVRDR